MADHSAEKEGQIKEETVKTWKIQQEEMKHKLILEDTEEWQRARSPSYVAGVDLSFIKGDSDSACCALVVCRWPDLEVAYQDIQMVKLTAPYIPGFLAFREGEHIVNAWNKMKEREAGLKPDVLMMDGNGLLHTRQFGLACFVGVQLDIPAVGVAKNLYQMEGLLRDEEHMMKIGKLKQAGESFLLYNEDTCLGKALRTTSTSHKPMYISVGHKIGLETASWLVQSCCKHRVPEPTRQADILSREYLRTHYPETS